MAKIDPRADPLSEPPQSKDDFSVDRVAVPKNAIAVESKVVPVGEAEAEDAETTPFVPSGKITSQDPRYEPIEKLLDANDWKKIGAELGSMEEIGKLPPNLGLVAALAHNENAKDGDPEAVLTAIRCMAGLLGLPETSPIARVLARRLLRKNPVGIRDRPAPPARTSLLIVLATLVIGGGVGWLASVGSWPAILRLLHL
jgi:hypothetical protein